MRLRESTSIHLVKIKGFDFEKNSATFMDNGWEIHVQDPNIRQALTGIVLNEPVVIKVRVENQQDQSTYYVLEEIFQLHTRWTNPEAVPYSPAG